MRELIVGAVGLGLGFVLAKVARRPPPSSAAPAVHVVSADTGISASELRSDLASVALTVTPDITPPENILDRGAAARFVTELLSRRVAADRRLIADMVDGRMHDLSTALEAGDLEASRAHAGRLRELLDRALDGRPRG